MEQQEAAAALSFCLSCLSADSWFRLSLNGSEPLEDTGQALASCGIVSGDLIHVVLEPPGPAPASDATAHLRGHAQEVAMATAEASQEERSDGGRDVPHEAAPPTWEPLLCSEAEAGQAPLSLELLFHSAQVGGATDALVAAAHLLMEETGFSPQVRREDQEDQEDRWAEHREDSDLCVCVCVQGCELPGGHMPAGWRCGGGVYKLQYCHRLCGDSVVTLVGVSLGSTLIVSGQKLTFSKRGFRGCRLDSRSPLLRLLGRAPGGEPIS